MADISVDQESGPSRRALLKGGAAAAGLAVGSGAITGFPTIWAQNIKDITLAHVGQSFSVIPQIAAQASKDLGFKIDMQAVDYATQLNRTFTQPESIDISDLSINVVPDLIKQGIGMPVPTSKYKWWDKTVPIFTKGEYPDGKKASVQGGAPIKFQYYADKDGTKLSATPTEWLASIPTLYNADTLGIRPDLVGHKIDSWAELINPQFKGKASLVDEADIGILDAAMALEAAGQMKYADKGNMTKAEIDKTIAALIELKKSGQFRSFWQNFDQSVSLMASGEVVIQSMWSPAVTEVRTRGIACEFVPLKEGYRGWGVTLVPMKHLSGLKLDAAMDYLNWYNSGWQGAFIARQGYYSTVPETAKAMLEPYEWDYWYEGKPAAQDIKDPFGKMMEKAGNKRDGGALWDRMGNVAVWNCLMDEQRYLTKRWNEFISA
ncbi:ABC transporter substrate-binding protein [Lichenifustis flavocetrariae]|uniref:Extracellular solute-binding protein n=1 Tax=Lichenifustis flavocetrariae TaxID=2949735 RepID=A0AA41YSQ0_9HYPH|nr:extracellular solute-binding protein [Lichenifustis flavocetrariae]MCW6506615.1 extracellular solute-binding protein [Lichenifustis flavocetrariae]